VKLRRNGYACKSRRGGRRRRNGNVRRRRDGWNSKSETGGSRSASGRRKKRLDWERRKKHSQKSRTKLNDDADWVIRDCVVSTWVNTTLNKRQRAGRAVTMTLSDLLSMIALKSSKGSSKKLRNANDSIRRNGQRETKGERKERLDLGLEADRLLFNECLQYRRVQRRGQATKGNIFANSMQSITLMLLARNQQLLDLSLSPRHLL
jgi:hypothetical protein